MLEPGCAMLHPTPSSFGLMFVTKRFSSPSPNDIRANAMRV